MSDPFVAEIRMAGFNFAPTGWAMANGQILSLSQNTALFSLLGTLYGGNGQSNFALPDLRDRVPIHADSNQYFLGSSGGSDVSTFALVPTAANPPAPITAISFQPGATNTASPYLVLNFIIALQGVYPSRP